MNQEVSLLYVPEHLEQVSGTNLVALVLSKKVACPQVLVSNPSTIEAFCAGMRDGFFSYLSLLDAKTYLEYEVDKDGNWVTTPPFLTATHEVPRPDLASTSSTPLPH